MKNLMSICIVVLVMILAIVLFALAEDKAQLAPTFGMLLLVGSCLVVFFIKS